jgi:hypothetical protein
MRESRFPKSVLINVRCVRFTPSHRNDQDIGGLYLIDINLPVLKFTLEELASIALAIFMSNVGMHLPDEFLLDVLDADNAPICEAINHIEGSGAKCGTVKQISFLPFELAQEHADAYPA